MCVAQGVRESLLERRRAAFLESTVDTFLAETKRLNISAKELITLIKERTNHD
jgi:DNA-binding transcriptional regulator YhcF (GntR family)